MKAIYIDTETTGLDPEKHGLVQVAGIISANGKQEEFDLKINPGRVQYDELAESINNFKRADIAKFPPSAEAYQEFIKLLDKHINRYDPKDKLFFIAYNADFDMRFIRKWFAKNDDPYFGSWFWHPPLDVMQLAAFELIGERPYMDDFKLGTLYEKFFGVPMTMAHDALGDVIAMKKVLNYILSKKS